MAQLKTSLILDLVDRMSRPAAKARGQLEKIQQTAGKIDGFRKLSKQTANTSKKMRQAQTRVAALAVKMRQAEKPSNRLKVSFKSAKKEAARYKTTLGAQSQKLELLRRNLHGSGVKTRELGKHQKQLARDAEKLTKKLKRLNAISKVMNSARGFGGSVLRAGKAAAKGVGIAVAAVTGASVLFNRFFVSTAATFERYRTILETLEGSNEKARKSMDWVSDFAAKTPFELDEVMGAFVKLRTFGLEPTNGLLKTLGDTSAAMGVPIIQGVEAIADAVTGENERLKEFGIKARVEGNKTVFEYTKNGETMRKVADNTNRAMIQSVLQSIWNDKFKGAMDKQSRTWKGMVSNLGDQWTRFVNMVMDAGAFDVIKGKLESLLVTINKMAKNGELKKMAEDLSGNVVKAVESIWRIGKVTISVFDKLIAKIDLVTKPLQLLYSLGNFIGTEAVNPSLELGAKMIAGTTGGVVLSSLGPGIELTDGAKRTLATPSRFGPSIAPVNVTSKTQNVGDVADVASRILNTELKSSVDIRIISDRPVKVDNLKSSSPLHNISVDTGAVMVSQ